MKVFILNFHTFNNQFAIIGDWTLTEFADIIDTFANEGFTFITTAGLLANTVVGNKNILITIDDGRSSVIPAYEAVLRPRKIQPLLAITTHLDDSMMTWEQIKQLHTDGCYIASHGYDHLHLDERLYTDTPELFMKELQESKKDLEMHLDTEINMYVYPYGEYITELFTILPKLGYRWGMRVGNETQTLPIIQQMDKYRLSRYHINHLSYKVKIQRILEEANRMLL